MPVKSKLFYSITIVVILGMNPKACTGLLKGCGKGCAKEASAEERVIVREVEERAITRSVEEHPVNWPSGKSTEIETPLTDEYKGTTIRNSDGSYTYKDFKYKSFSDIPFKTGEEIYFEEKITSEMAKDLMKKGVNFVYHNAGYLNQRNKGFKVIYLISDEVNVMKNLYELDEEYAKALIDYSANIQQSEKIIKVSSFNSMIEKQNEVLRNNEIPILVFHNGGKKIGIPRFNPEANFITCNSFETNPDSYLVSTQLLDMQAVITAVNKGAESETLSQFYSNFTTSYSTHMRNQHQQFVLTCLAGTGGVGGGAYAIAYYSHKNS